jgi:excinuclease ABC subunit B
MFDLVSSFPPAGGQPPVLEILTEGLASGLQPPVLRDATGSGKPLIITNISQQVNRRTLMTLQ